MSIYYSLFCKIHSAVITQSQLILSKNELKTFRNIEIIAISNLFIDLINISYQRLSYRHCAIIICHPSSETCNRHSGVRLSTAGNFLYTMRYTCKLIICLVPVRFTFVRDQAEFDDKRRKPRFFSPDSSRTMTSTSREQTVKSARH